MDTIVYLVFVIAAGLSQRSYFDAMARQSNSVKSLDSVGHELQARPSALFRTVVARTIEYLRALLSRQEDPELEFKRLRAVALIGAMVFVFVVFVAT